MLVRSRWVCHVRSCAARSTASPYLGDYVAKGGLRNGLLVQASLDRIPLFGLDLAAWTADDTALSPKGNESRKALTQLSRTPVSKQVSVEQTRLQNGDPRADHPEGKAFR